MSDVNAVIVQPFKQFVKVSRCVKNEHGGDAPAASRPLRHHTTAQHTRRRCAVAATRTHHPSPTQDSIHLVKKCTKPDRKEFARIASATMIGFLIMGFVGFFVKLVHIPINNILMT